MLYFSCIKNKKLLKTKRQRIATRLRLYRKIHQTTGLITFIAFVAIGITGILLGWKKNSSGYILPETQKGISTDVNSFKSIKELSDIAEKSILAYDADNKIKRLDLRPSKGMVKVTFKNNYYGVQIDATTGEVLQVNKRNSDLIENIHDGSYIDDMLGIKSRMFKLFYTSITGLSLLIFSFTGFWLWYGPKAMRKK